MPASKPSVWTKPASNCGQRYISVFFDLDPDRLLFTTEGRSKETFKHFVKDYQYNY